MARPRPLVRQRDLARDPSRVPAFQPVARQTQSRALVGLACEQWRNRFRRRWIGHTTQIDVARRSPVRALVRELEGVVKVECVDHVVLAHRLDRDQRVRLGPVRPSGNDRVLRRLRAHRTDKPRLHSRPLVQVNAIGFVQNFEVNLLRVCRRVMMREHTPEIDEPHRPVFACGDVFHPCLLGMNIQHDGQSIGSNLLHGPVEPRYSFRA